MFTKTFWQNSVFIVAGLLCVVSWYFYQPQIISYWNQGMENSRELSVNSFNALQNFSVNSWQSSDELSANAWIAYAGFFQKVSFPALKLPKFYFSLPVLSLPSFDFKFPSFNFQMPSFNFKWPTFSFPSFHFPSFKLPSFSFKIPALVFNLPVLDFGKIFGIAQTENNKVADCGTTISPNLKNPATYEKNAVLTCLGRSALRCDNAAGVLTDGLFPTNFEISKNGNSCIFKLSYPEDSALSDITGNKLAGQYISCPISITREADDTNPNAVKFIAPDKTDLAKYASQIYFYGTLGLFAQNNLDKNQIVSAGCNGSYIDSMIASYQKMQAKH
ncbi:MAG: hypothetical protein WAN61_01415 [Minisyncoccia bacterium]